MLLTAGALPARAELVFFATGRNLSVKSHRVEGDMIVLEMRGGGEMTCEASLVDRIAPDEVPYPEPPPAAIAELNRGPSNHRASQPAARNQCCVLIRSFRRVAREQGVDASIVRAVIQVESGYEPRARSRRGAMGLMQADARNRAAVRRHANPCTIPQRTSKPAAGI